MAKQGEIAASGGRRGARPRVVLAGLAMVLDVAGLAHAQAPPADPAAFTEAVAGLYRGGQRPS